MLVLLIVLAVLLLTYLYRTVSKPKNFPPGPIWWPIIGNIVEMRRFARSLGGIFAAFQFLSQRHKTDILGLKLGAEHVVVVQSYELCREVLLSDVFNARPVNFFLLLRCLGKQNGVTCTDGVLHTIQRNFVVRHLRTLGLGRPVMETMIHDELRALKTTLLANTTGLQVNTLFGPAILNILWMLIGGRRFTSGDEQVGHLLDLLRMRSRAFDMAGGTLNQLPWLRHIAPDWTGYNLICKLNRELRNFLVDTIAEHQSNWTVERQNDDLIYAFLTQMRQADTNTTFTHHQLVMICLDMFVAGSETTSNVLNFAFLTLILWPEVQTKLHEHIDANLKPDEPFKYADRDKIPYVEAVLLEVHRFFTSIPLIGPRRALQATSIGPYAIPKDTTVLLNTHTVHHDKTYWPDPDAFRPERFLNRTATALDAHSTEHLLTFGLGKRRCLGEVLARNCLLLFFVEIVRGFRVENGAAKMPSARPKAGITLAPELFHARFIRRNTS